MVLIICLCVAPLLVHASVDIDCTADELCANSATKQVINCTVVGDTLIWSLKMNGNVEDTKTYNSTSSINEVENFTLFTTELTLRNEAMLVSSLSFVPATEMDGLIIKCSNSSSMSSQESCNVTIAGIETLVQTAFIAK